MTEPHEWRNVVARIAPVRFFVEATLLTGLSVGQFAEPDAGYLGGSSIHTETDL
jgi:hypothetical protein